MKPERLALIIAVLTLAAAAVAILIPPRQGLDIQGGMRVVLEAETDKLPPGQEWTPEMRNSILRILDRRVNATGVAEPTLAARGDNQFVIELPAVRNKEQVLAQIQTTARLEFYYSADWVTNRNPLGRFEFQPGDAADDRVAYLIQDRQTNERFRDLYQINQEFGQITDRAAQTTEGLTEVVIPSPLRELAAAGRRETIPLPAEDAARVPALNEELTRFQQFMQLARLELTGENLRPNSAANFDPTRPGQAVVDVEFTPEGARRFADFTRDHVGEILMIYLDGQILSTPNIEQQITQGRAQISPFASLEDAQRLATLLNAGALPVPLAIAQQQSIEATLGQDAVRAGLVSGIIGLALVLLFMGLYYLLPGAVACLALVLYTLFVYAIFVSVGVTFTLPGIAAFVLSIGMAIDANILIFERTKEELRAGKPLRQAIDLGFQRAFSAIIDSNICTAVTSLLLFYFGTGPIRGFAVTLLIGVAVSMFTALTVTRTLLLLVARTSSGKNLSAWGIRRTFMPRWDIVSRRNIWFALSFLLIVPGLIFVFMGGLRAGIDFRGGSELTLRFAQPVTRPQVAQAATEIGVQDAVVQIAEENTVFLRAGEMTRQQATDVVNGLNARFPGVTEQSFEMIGATISQELTRNAVTAIVLASVFIILYLTMRFAIGGFANGLKFGVCAIVAMLHDVGLLIGAFAVLGYFANWTVDSLFVTALLTVIGYSVHDTIVIFDRIRENLRHRARGESFEHLVNKSINESFARSVNTSLTVLLVLIPLIIWGGPVIRPLNVALFIGILAGTYSSIFNAAPLLVLWERLSGRGDAASRTTARRTPLPAAAGGGGSLPPGANGASQGAGDGARRPAPQRDAGDSAEGRDPREPRTRPTTPPAQRRRRRM